jgi:intein-encoded DNA endonuclease-like protein
MRRSYTKEHYEKVLSLHKKGLGCRKISKETNIPILTIYQWLYKNVKPRKISERFWNSRIWLDKKRWPEVIKKATESKLKSKKFWEARKRSVEKITKKLPESSKTPSKELGYILGVIYGDGYLDKYTIKLKVKDLDFAEIFAETISKWSGHSCSIRKDKLGLYIVRFYSVRACKFLSSIKLTDIKNWGIGNKISFLRGLFDSEGCVPDTTKRAKSIIFYNSNKRIINITSFLLNELDITHSITSRKPSEGKIGRWKFIRKRNYCISITNYENKKKFYNLIGFSIKRKQDRLKYLENPPSNNFVSKETIFKMIELRNQRCSYNKIAKELNLSESTVFYHINKTVNGVPPW